MDWLFSNDRAIYTQIIEQVRFFIISGKLLPGEKLLSVRDLAAQAGVNPNTMQRALSELERTGLVYSSRTLGRFVTEDTKKIENEKKDYALLKINEFMLKMKELGYSKSEVVNLLEN